jgi:hypothetical protein
MYMNIESIPQQEREKGEKVSLEKFSELLRKHPAIVRMLTAGALAGSLWSASESKAQEVSDLGEGDYQRNFDTAQEVREVKNEVPTPGVSHENLDMPEVSPEQSEYNEKFEAVRETLHTFVITQQVVDLEGPMGAPVDMTPALTDEQIEEIARENAESENITVEDFQELSNSFVKYYEDISEAGRKSRELQMELLIRPLPQDFQDLIQYHQQRYK